MKLSAKKIGQLFCEKPYDALLSLAFVIVVILLIRLYLSLNDDDEKWEQFKKAHNCQLRISKTEIHHSSWICDDGNTYYRWRQQR